MIDQDARMRIQVLEEWVVERDRDIADLFARFTRFSAPVHPIRPDVSGPLPSLPARKALTLTGPPTGFTSLIVSDFPPLFTEFSGKHFALLWRGSRDGFRAANFHERCDAHANTLTLIEDTGGSNFGGFTPLEWESRPWRGSWDDAAKADPSLRSFLFTLKNPHNLPPRKFALKAERSHQAIGCVSSWGPNFWDIGVAEATGSYTDWFNTSYANDTGLPDKTFFTNPARFTVKEVEVFAITD
jgi:hypothetical protein